MVDEREAKAKSDKKEDEWLQGGGSEEVLSKMTFLGCTLKRYERKVGEKTLQCIEYDVEDSLKKALDKYEEVVRSLTGQEPGYHDAGTPFIEESTKDSPYRAPCDPAAKAFVECPSCRHTVSKEFAATHCTFKAGTPRKVAMFKDEEEE